MDNPRSPSHSLLFGCKTVRASLKFIPFPYLMNKTLLMYNN